ncbi:MAG: TerC family protein [Bacteroidales bacterium]|nr:TerC family protein [Bacteroidales bacterium]
MEFVFAVLTLAFLEVVLGIDNIMFISLVTNKLPASQQNRARIIGLVGAMATRIILLVSMVWLIHHLEAPFFPLDGFTDFIEAKEHAIEEYLSETHFFKKIGLLFHTIGVREVVLLAGGLFLLSKSVSEINHKVEGEAKEIVSKQKTMTGTIIEIMAVDLVFSFDSILTAIGITDNLPAMIIAVVISIFVMMLFAKKISQFMAKHPSLEVMGLSFLILIGVMLILDSVHIEVPKGYIYFAVFFSLAVEVINLKVKKEHSPIKLKKKHKNEITD